MSNSRRTVVCSSRMETTPVQVAQVEAPAPALVEALAEGEGATLKDRVLRERKFCTFHSYLVRNW